MTYQVSHAQGELLAQINPGVITPVLLYQQPAGVQGLRTEVTLIEVCIFAPVIVTLYHDDDGVIYDPTTALFCRNYTAIPTQVDRHPYFQAQHPGSGIMIQPGGSLGIEVSVAGNANINVYGVTETLAERVRGLT
jgi:hypothetical protein